MTVEELSGRMSSREFAEWMAFYRIEPFGDQRADMRSAIVASTMANLLGKKKFAPADFMLFTERKTETLSDRVLGFFKNRS
jgi:hypothetical protein